VNPIKLSKELQTVLVNYLSTTFDVDRDKQEPALAAFIQQSFARPRALFAGPYLEFTPPHKTSETLEELAKVGVISPRLLQMPCFQEDRPVPVDVPLYTHQVAALRKLCAEDRNIVVSSGTGSGKTECFLIPILNDLLLDTTPGVRAVLVYPLNALVNDQLDRLRILLRGTGITFGRYTSELAESADRARKEMEKEWREMDPARQQLFDQYPLTNEIIGRDQIQEQGMLPQILITNYAMLEYLLLRPQDNPLFTQGKWRFLVLDEAHTYAGAQGIEVGLLIRRLKLRLGHQPGQMRCIATSATLTTDDAPDAAAFAESLFGEAFMPDDIIFGQLDHDYVPPAEVTQPPVEAYIHSQFNDLIHNVRQENWESTDEMALLMQEIGLIGEADLALADQYDPPHFLWEVLRGNADIIRLRNLMADKGQPVEMMTVAENLFHDRLSLAHQQQEALYHLVELAAMARPDADKPSLLPARYHLFVRPPQGIWGCLNPTCPDKQPDTKWSKLFATQREHCDSCQSPVYPLVVCRTCGQVYVRLHKVNKQFLAEAALEDEAEKRYVTWRAIHENRALADGVDEIDEGTGEVADDEDSLMEQAGESILKQVEMTLCLVCQQTVNANGRCGCEGKSDRTVLLYLLMSERAGKKGKNVVVKPEVVKHLNECGRCHSRALKDTEIATEITMNALTPLAVLVEELYSALPQSPNVDTQNKPGGGRKLLSFYDSRQGAARFAAFVQDVANQQAYRRMIREAVSAIAIEDHLPDLEKVGEKCLELALAYRVAHNDPEIEVGDQLRHAQYLSKSQRERLTHHMHTQILAEITTQLRSRQSLETLGLLTVQYFEPTHLPDFASLAEQIKLSPTETRTLVEYLLDDLRRGKVVTLPQGVRRDNPIFGRNKFSPRFVRSEPRTDQGEIGWIGKTARQGRRQLIKKVLAYKGLANDDAAIIDVLDRILDWLVDKSRVLDTSQPSKGYQIRHDHLFFQTKAQWYRCSQCQRLNNRGAALPCPHTHCHGTLQPIEMDEVGSSNFYYENLRQQIIPMRVEEHTAQLSPERGREYQNKFKNGEINMLSCSTTFEMGIDLGDLQAVVMSNIPPTVANYKQRAGRAGRRARGTAFILAWASNRPHDQSYFKAPPEMIGGNVRVPFIDMQNPIIIQRHINAILLSEFLRCCASQGDKEKTIGAFFDTQSVNGGYYQLLPPWVEANKDYLLNLLSRYAVTVKGTIEPARALHAFMQDLREKGYEHYQTVAGYYKREQLRLAEELITLIQQGDNPELAGEIAHFGNLLKRTQEEDCINHLSDRGVLPSYSFPLYVVELRIPYHLQQARHLRLQRDLQLAIREYAPGQEVVADKRIWKSEALDFFGKVPQLFAYYICHHCNYLRLEETAGKSLDTSERPCPICHSFPKPGKPPQNFYIQPDGFRTTNNSGAAAGQYVDRPQNLMRSALVPRAIETVAVSPVLSMGYDHNGALLYVNEGFQGKGFYICRHCGKQARRGVSKCDGKFNGQPCPGKIEVGTPYTLGFRQKTDTIHLKFSGTPHIRLPEAENNSFWLSLKYALLQGASRALQIERRDIDGVLFPELLIDSPREQWQHSIVLYDNVPGGAGNVKRIQDKIREVIAAALEIIDCECEKSCYRCLREYANQWEHKELDRGQIVEFLRALDADLHRHSSEEVAGLSPVAALNQTDWLWEQVGLAQQELILVGHQITLESPRATGLSWLDLLQQLIQRGVKVSLVLQELPSAHTHDGEALYMRSHLRLLLQKGLDLRQSNRQPTWLAVIDPNGAAPCAIRTDGGTINPLGHDIGRQLAVTTNQEAVMQSWKTMQQFRGRAVESGELEEPAATQMREIVDDHKKHSEAEFFSEFYASPVRGILINDRYLQTREQILNRLGAHIELAQQGNALEWVRVKAVRGSGEQNDAIHQLKAKFPNVKITFDLDDHNRVPHDRSIEITRVNGSKARAVIGVGLDFIDPDGFLRRTFLVFQNLGTRR
jgi:hypothetical protein